jgi:predicted DNA-binding protein
MTRLDTFAMRVSAEERQMIKALAQRLQRSQSDVVRLLVREAVQGLAATADQQPQAEGGGGDG